MTVGTELTHDHTHCILHSKFLERIGFCILPERRTISYALLHVTSNPNAAASVAARFRQSLLHGGLGVVLVVNGHWTWLGTNRINCEHYLIAVPWTIDL